MEWLDRMMAAIDYMERYGIGYSKSGCRPQAMSMLTLPNWRSILWVTRAVKATVARFGYL